MKEIQAYPGEYIARACERLVAEAPAWTEFNGVRIEASPGDSASDLHGRWSAEMDRRQRAYEASDECKQHRADAERRAVEERRVRDEAMRAIDASGVRTKYPWNDAMGEISGFGGGYEEACRDMVYAGLAWLESRPPKDLDLSSSTTDDARALDKVVLAACPGCSGAMYGATTNAVAFIAKQGWATYVERMSARERGR